MQTSRMGQKVLRTVIILSILTFAHPSMGLSKSSKENRITPLKGTPKIKINKPETVIQGVPTNSHLIWFIMFSNYNQPSKGRKK